MTVSIQDTVFPYVPNGVTKSFPFSCLVTDAEDIAVTIDGNEVTSGFTVSGVGDPTGGSVDFTAAPTGSKLVVRRLLKLERQTDYQQHGDWKAAVVNPDFDRTIMIAQQLQEQLNRSLQIALGESNGAGSFRANFNRIQDVADPVSPQDAANQRSVQLLIETFLSNMSGSVGPFLQLGAGAVVRTFQDKMRDAASVFDFMSAAMIADVQTGNPVMDHTAAVQAAVNCGKPVYFPWGTYLISTPISLPETAVLFSHAPQLYPNFSTDWMTPVPTFAGKCAILQYAPGLHGSIFDPQGGNNTLSGLVFRCGQARTADDCLFPQNKAPSMMHVDHCIFQNLNHLGFDPAHAWGAWFFQNNQVMGLSSPFSGAMVDMRIIGNTFTSCVNTCISVLTGGGFNLIMGNRLEWGSAAGYSAFQSAGDIICNNLFDAFASAGIVLTSASDFAITGNRFTRNGRNAVVGDQSHIRLFSNCSGNYITANAFKSGANDNGTGGPWPNYIIEFESVIGKTNTYKNNTDTNGYALMPVWDRYGTSGNSLFYDKFDVPAGFGNANTATDTLSQIVSAISGVAVEPGRLYLYDNRQINSFVSGSKAILTGVGAAGISITNGAGNVTGAAGFDNVNYGGVTYKRIGGCQYASAQPNGFGGNGTFPVGAAIFNTAPAAGGKMGWVKTAAGNPDTWKAWGAIDA